MTAVRANTSNEREVTMKVTPEDADILDDPDMEVWFGMPKIQRPSHCPQCGSEQTKRIVYGLPGGEDPTPVEERDYVLGGCLFNSDSPQWYCGACGHKWR